MRCAGTENRIATARKDYNDAVLDYNTHARAFPTVISAKLLDSRRSPTSGPRKARTNRHRSTRTRCGKIRINNDERGITQISVFRVHPRLKTSRTTHRAMVTRLPTRFHAARFFVLKVIDKF